MSRYTLNKLLWHIDRDDDVLAAYRSDPRRFVAEWQESVNSPTPPYPDGGSLTHEESEAFRQMDTSALYELGAHPYLLWHYVRAVLLKDGMTVQELSEEFKAGIRTRQAPRVDNWTFPPR